MVIKLDKVYRFKDTWFKVVDKKLNILMWLLLDEISSVGSEYKIYKEGLEIASFRKIKVLAINAKQFEIKIDAE